MDDLRNLEIYLSDDERAAQQAFDRLMRVGNCVIRAYLNRQVSRLNFDDIEDIVLQVKLNIWRARGHIKNNGVAAFMQLLRKTSRNCALDVILNRRNTIEIDDVDDLSETDQPFTEDFIHTILDSKEPNIVHHLADSCFLGLNPDFSSGMHRRQLLAAQYYYQDGLSWSQIVQILGAEELGKAQITREKLDSWLLDPAVIRYMCFTELYKLTVEITALILGLPESTSHQDLSKLLQTAIHPNGAELPPSGWTWRETAVIIFKYLYALLDKTILSNTKIEITEEELLELTVRCDALLPFSKCMSVLMNDLSRNSGLNHSDTVLHSGLWKRLVFEYRYIEELPHRDIHNYLNPAAEQVGYKLTLAMLNAWISSDRMLQQVRNFRARREESIYE